MQSYNAAPSGFGWKSSIVQKRVKGKENGLNAPTCLQADLQKPTLEKYVPQDTPKSRLPILSKAKEPPDFQKLHQSWQNQFQKGKAVKKKSCTRPQPFNFSQKGDRSQVPVTTKTGQSVNTQACHRREPLAEVTLGQKDKESKDTDVKGGSEEFKADPAALASILSDLGVPVVATGKLSLAQRVPMRVSSIAPSSNICKKTVARSSMYAVLRSESASSNLDRMSCFSKMQTKEHFPRCIVEHPDGKNNVLRPNPLLKSHVPGSSLRELVAFNLDDKLVSQENPVLQQMNQTDHVQASSVISSPLTSQEVTTMKSSPVTEYGGSSGMSADNLVLGAGHHHKPAGEKYTRALRGCEKNTSEVDSCIGRRDLMKTGSASVEFVADLQALASILSNTGVTTGNCGKLSLAQRVPVQERSASVKGGMTTSRPSAVYATIPKPLGRMSTMAVPIKDIAFSPCRVPKTLIPDKSSSGSATRVHHFNFSTMKFSQGYSVRSKQPFFPKTPRTMAQERANKKLETELSDTRPSIGSTVKWADELSPSMSETLCENEPKMEKVAMRLFLDGDCPRETDEKKEPAEESDCLKGSGAQKRTEATLPENPASNAVVAAFVGVSQDLLVHTNVHPSTASLKNAADPPVQHSNMVSCMKTTLPLSFLFRPAVQALQSRALGPCSLPDIARLRIQAAVSAKQRFWETCLDEECAFYTSRGAISSYRSCIDPVSSFLDRQEDLHFTPIISGEL